MKFIIKYSFIGVIVLLVVVEIITQLPLSHQLSNTMLTVSGLILFTILGALLKTKVKINSTEQSTHSRNK
jgi:hypothetical protein